MGSRPEFSIPEFVRARRAFADGRGPVAAWAQITEITLWRLDGVAERARCRRWAVLIAPAREPADDVVQQRLDYAVRSAQLGAHSLAAYWRLDDERVTVSRVHILYDAVPYHVSQLAHRHRQDVVVLIQRVPFEHVVVLDVAAEARVEFPRFEPTAIVDALLRVIGAEAVAVVYRWTTIGEGLAMAIAERRLRGR